MIYDKASLVQIPSGYKGGLSNGTLYNVVPNTADGDFRHTRPSSATRVNKDGLIETVASNVPRLDYPLLDGVVQDCPALLLEPSRQNKLTDSEDFYQWGNATALVTRNEAIAPDGNLSADTVLKNGSFVAISKTTTITSGVDNIFTVFVKPKTTNYITIRQASGSNDVRRYFNVATGETSSAGGNNTGFQEAKIEEYANGWYRVSVRATSDGTTLTSNIYAGQAGNTTYDGEIYVWGAQIEEGSYATSYIPTSGSAVTRTVDYASGGGNSDTFNDSEGTLFIDAAALGNDGTYRVLNISDGTSSNRVLIQLGNNNNQIRADLVSGGATQTSLSTTSYTFTDFNKIAFKYKGDDTALFVNGTQVGATITGKTMPTGLDRIDFTNGSLGSTFYFRGKLKQLMTFNEALSDTELENLTSWDSFREMATEQLYTIE